MSDFFVQISKLKLEIEAQIDDLHISKEYSLSTKEPDFMKEYHSKIKSIESILGKINNEINDLNAMIKKISDSPDSQKNQRKISNLESQSKDLIQHLRKVYQFKLNNLNTEKNKFELFGKRTNTPDSENGFRILIKEQESLKNSILESNTSLETGRNILFSLKNQQDLLKNVQKKMFTMLNEAGLSISLTKLIERRSKNDIFLLLFCFSLLMSVILIFYFYLRPMIRN